MQWDAGIRSGSAWTGAPGDCVGVTTFLGVFGIHRFYAGKIGTGLLQLVTMGGFGLWAIVDNIMIAWGTFTDGHGERITRWT
jgi:TM2 domain-containing membrane protein YozV